jgi:hypothetical protein
MTDFGLILMDTDLELSTSNTLLLLQPIQG